MKVTYGSAANANASAIVNINVNAHYHYLLHASGYLLFKGYLFVILHLLLYFYRLLHVNVFLFFGLHRRNFRFPLLNLVLVLRDGRAIRLVYRLRDPILGLLCHVLVEDRGFPIEFMRVNHVFGAIWRVKRPVKLRGNQPSKVVNAILVRVLGPRLRNVVLLLLFFLYFFRLFIYLLRFVLLILGVQLRLFLLKGGYFRLNYDDESTIFCVQLAIFSVYGVTIFFFRFFLMHVAFLFNLNLYVRVQRHAHAYNG